MPVQSVECLLTQAQIKRYLAGADLPDELLVPIETHLKACPECMAEANRQREALGGSANPPVDTAPSKPSLLASLKDRFAGKQKDEALLTPVGVNGEADPMVALRSPKNIALSVSLAIVLILMSTAMKNPSTLFGPRAIEAQAVSKAHDKSPKAESDGHKPEIASGSEEKAAIDDKGHGKSEGDGEEAKHPVAANTPGEEKHEAGGDEDLTAHENKEGHKQPAVDKHVDSSHDDPPAETHEPSDDHAAHSAPTKSSKTHEPAHKSETVAPKVAEPSKVGGSVIVAEASHAKAVARTPATTKKSSPHKVRRVKPRLKVNRKPVKQAPRNGIRIYHPDGSPKH